MKLEKKSANIPVQQTSKQKDSAGNLSPSQKKLYREALSNEIPAGKYKGQTLLWVKTNDDSYYRWLCKEELLYPWGLMELRENAMSPQIKKDMWFISSDGERWLQLREVQEPTTASIWL